MAPPLPCGIGSIAVEARFRESPSLEEYKVSLVCAAVPLRYTLPQKFNFNRPFMYRLPRNLNPRNRPLKISFNYCYPCMIPPGAADHTRVGTGSTSTTAANCSIRDRNQKNISIRVTRVSAVTLVLDFSKPYAPPCTERALYPRHGPWRNTLASLTQLRPVA